MTTTVLNTKISEVENKTSDTSGLMTTTVLKTKITEVENKIADHAKYITAPEFTMLIAENFVARLKQANLEPKTGFDNKLISFNKKISSNKTKYLEVQKKLIIIFIIINDYNFFLDKMYFTSNDVFQNTLVINQHLIH